MGRLWDDELLDELLPRDQREAIKRLDTAHYMKCGLAHPCDMCLVLDALREILSDVHTARCALGGM